MSAFLGEVGGCEIDGNAFGRQRQRYGIQRTAHSLGAFGHGLSGSPTMVKPGSPGPIWICTSTARASIPSKATVVTRANIPEPPSKLQSL